MHDFVKASCSGAETRKVTSLDLRVRTVICQLALLRRSQKYMTPITEPLLNTELRSSTVITGRRSKARPALIPLLGFDVGYITPIDCACRHITFAQPKNLRCTYAMHRGMSSTVIYLIARRGIEAIPGGVGAHRKYIFSHELLTHLGDAGAEVR